jgi:membrane-associated phospholipid phosphatase
MLELRPNCECCGKDLPPEAADAMICSFECTFCRDCVENALGGRCPNCGGSLAARPLRPAAKLAEHPPSARRVVRAEGCDGERARLNARANRRLDPVRIWLLALFVTAVCAAYSFKNFDLPAARWALLNVSTLGQLGNHLGSAIILTAEGALALTLVCVRLWRGHISPLSKALILASLTSMCAYAVNGEALKVIFGVPNPSQVLLAGVHHGFNFLKGNDDSSFPSGHMALAGAFLGVFMRLYPAYWRALSVLAVFGAALLVCGDWHFISDVIAGTFEGVTVGLLAGALWQAHIAGRTAPI